MPDWIPQSLHERVSPLLVLAGRWPEAADLVPLGVIDDRSPDAERLRTGLVPIQDALLLLHPALANEPPGARLHRDAHGWLYYKLGHAEPVPMPRDGDTFLRWKDWNGWGSWAPCQSLAIAFAVRAELPAARGKASRKRLEELLSEVLAPDLAGEAAACDDDHMRAAPGVDGPAHYAATYSLDREGFGLMYPNLYGYTDGRTVVACLQIVPHDMR